MEQLPERLPSPEKSNANTVRNLQEAPDITDLKADILLLRGSAGTGKTTLIGQWVKLLLEKKIPFALLATTGRAAKILSDKTDHVAQTIHSAIYSFLDIKGTPDDDHIEILIDQAGQLYFEFFIRSQLDDFNPSIYIIDEASMLTHEITHDNHTAIFGSGSVLDDMIAFLGNAKIILVGDHCQLPPVTGSPFSPALHGAFMASRYQKNVDVVDLQINWRHSEGNEILDIANTLRNHILNNTAIKGMKIPRPVGRNVFVATNIREMVQDYFLKTVKPRRYEDGVIIAASNKMVSDLNTQVRDKLNYHRLPQPGEILLVVQNQHTTGLVNGDMVVLEEFKSDVVIQNISLAKVKVKSLHTGDIFETMMITDLLYSAEPSLNTHNAGKLIIDYDIRARKRGLKRKSENYRTGLKTDPYLNALRAKFGYALTCHKSQGGEWDVVYLALNGAPYYWPPITTARWFYTAITRAKKELHINNGPWIAQTPYY